jgi:hypothetical protein
VVVRLARRIAIAASHGVKSAATMTTTIAIMIAMKTMTTMTIEAAEFLR